jgi:hypothetical protein
MLRVARRRRRDTAGAKRPSAAVHAARRKEDVREKLRVQLRVRHFTDRASATQGVGDGLAERKLRFGNRTSRASLTLHIS